MFAFKDFWLTQQSPFFARAHLWHPPEEPLVQMPRGHREDVDRIFLVLLRLFSLASTCETSERQNEKRLFDSLEHLKIKNEICFELHLVREFQKPVSFSSVPSLSSSSLNLSGFFWTWSTHNHNSVSHNILWEEKRRKSIILFKIWIKYHMTWFWFRTETYTKH